MAVVDGQRQRETTRQTALAEQPGQLACHMAIGAVVAIIFAYMALVSTLVGLLLWG